VSINLAASFGYGRRAGKCVLERETDTVNTSTARTTGPTSKLYYGVYTATVNGDVTLMWQSAMNSDNDGHANTQYTYRRRLSTSNMQPAYTLVRAVFSRRHDSTVTDMIYRKSVTVYSLITGVSNYSEQNEWQLDHSHPVYNVFTTRNTAVY